VFILEGEHQAVVRQDILQGVVGHPEGGHQGPTLAHALQDLEHLVILVIEHLAPEHLALAHPEATQGTGHQGAHPDPMILMQGNTTKALEKLQAHPSPTTPPPTGNPRPLAATGDTRPDHQAAGPPCH